MGADSRDNDPSDRKKRIQALQMQERVYLVSDNHYVPEYEKENARREAKKGLLIEKEPLGA